MCGVSKALLSSGINFKSPMGFPLSPSAICRKDLFQSTADFGPAILGLSFFLLSFGIFSSFAMFIPSEQLCSIVDVGEILCNLMREFQTVKSTGNTQASFLLLFYTNLVLSILTVRRPYSISF